MIQLERHLLITTIDGIVIYEQFIVDIVVKLTTFVLLVSSRVEDKIKKSAYVFVTRINKTDD